jgi:hypothetical protein
LSSYTILVNSCDAFSDCWSPFFTLFQHYWPGCRAPIILNTERLDFTWPGLNVRASRVARNELHKLTWSKALVGCLDQIETDQVLYVQEDYFLNAVVEGALIDEFSKLMKRENVATVQLTPFGSDGPFRATAHPLLWEIDMRAPYRIALQAALWDVSKFRSYTRSHENAWQFEMLGTVRSRRMPDVFCAVNRDIFCVDGRQIFPYVKTGIIKGQWYQPAVVDLFQRHRIDIDYSARGFFRERSRTVERLRTCARILGQPADLVRSLR